MSLKAKILTVLVTVCLIATLTPVLISAGEGELKPVMDTEQVKLFNNWIDKEVMVLKYNTYGILESFNPKNGFCVIKRYLSEDKKAHYIVHFTGVNIYLLQSKITSLKIK